MTANKRATMTQRYDIVISGANYTALSLACALAQALRGDLSIAILDRSTGPTGPNLPNASPRAFAMSSGSKRMFEILGIWKGISDHAQPVSEIEITDSSLEAGIRPVLLTYDNHLDDGEPASFIVPDAVIATALRQAAKEAKNVEWITGAEAISFDEIPGGLSVALADGHSCVCSLLVAADGRRSKIRDLAGIGVVEWDYKQSGICTTITHEEPHNGRAIQHFLPSGPFAILPLPGNKSCVTWTEERQEANRLMAMDDTSFLDELTRRFGHKLGELSLVGTRASWPLSMHMARRFIAPRIALVGDTARGVHPIAGQGLNLGLRDVAALAETTTESVRVGLDAGDQQALERYERWRRFDSTLSTAAFDGLNRLFSNDTTLLRSLREAGLGLVDRLPFAKAAFVKEAAGLTGNPPRLLQGQPL